MILRRIRAGLQARMSPRRPRRDDAGFTLVELLVVVIVTPLVIGALAEAFIVTLQQDTNNKNRLTDSANAQITSAYFVRDVQGASEITTFDYQAPLQLNGPPQVCGPGLGTLVVAFFHPPTSANPALDVSYRVQGNQIKRYSCTYNQATNTSTAPVGVLISDDLGTAANDLQVDISPSQFCGTVGNPNCPASTGWMSIAASNGLASTQNLSSSTIYVDGVTGFVPNQPITVYSTTGPVQITCGSVTAGATPNFGSCTGGPNATGLTGATVTQGSVSEVQISINQPSSSYRYALTGSPRSSTLADLGACSTCGQFPALLTLGNNPGAHFNGTTSLNVTGGMMVDGGQLGCTGTPSITVSGGIAITGSTSNTCTSQTVATQPFVQDPIEGQLPTPCFPQLAASPTDGSSTGTLQPGRYTSQISFNTGTTYLRPGVYELDGGIDLHGGGNLAMAPGTPVGQGVLLYVPGPGSPTEPSGCAKTAPQTINMGGGSTLHLPPLGTAPVPASLSNVPVLQQMWIWEDGSVPSGTTASLSGNNTAGQPAGLAYLPGTNVTLFGTPGEVTGKIIAANLTLGGTATVVVQGY